MNTRPYPSLGPAQGGVGPGADQSAGQEAPQDNIANLAKLMALVGINPLAPGGADAAKAFFAGLGLPVGKRIGAQALSRGITDRQTGVEAQQPPQPPQTPQPMPPMGAQPMQPGRPF